MGYVFCFALCSALEALINFAYSGRIQIDTTNVQLLLVGSSFLHLQVVKDACCDFMRNRYVSSVVTNIRVIQNSVTIFRHSIYTVCKKTAPLRQVGINSVVFRIQKIRNIRFIGNFILNRSCEFYYDDVTMTSFIGNK